MKDLQTKLMRYGIIGISVILVPLIIILSLEKSFKDVLPILIMYMFIIACILVIYVSKSGFKCKYLDSEIRLYWFGWNYKKISYAKIKGIDIRVAVDRHSFPIKDINGRQMAVISLYASEYSFRQSIKPNSYICIPYKTNNMITCSCLSVYDLCNLLKNTELDIYITEEVMTLYKNELNEILIQNPLRIRIVCSSVDKQTIIVSYNHYHESICSN